MKLKQCALEGQNRVIRMLLNMTCSLNVRGFKNKHAPPLSLLPSRYVNTIRIILFLTTQFATLIAVSQNYNLRNKFRNPLNSDWLIDDPADTLSSLDIRIVRGLRWDLGPSSTIRATLFLRFARF